MNKSTVLIAILGLVVLSCKKERVCQCSTSTTVSGVTFTTSKVYTLNAKHTVAKRECQFLEDIANDGGGSTSCKLK